MVVDNGIFFAHILDIVDFVGETLLFRSVLYTSGNIKGRHQYEVNTM